MIMNKLQTNGLYKIKVTNLRDNTVWFHKKVPAADVKCLALNENLKVEVIRLESQTYKVSDNYSDSEHIA